MTSIAPARALTSSRRRRLETRPAITPWRPEIVLATTIASAFPRPAVVVAEPGARPEAVGARLGSARNAPRRTGGGARDAECRRDRGAAAGGRRRVHARARIRHHRRVSCRSRAGRCADRHLAPGLGADGRAGSAMSPPRVSSNVYVLPSPIPAAPAGRPRRRVAAPAGCAGCAVVVAAPPTVREVARRAPTLRPPADGDRPRGPGASAPSDAPPRTAPLVGGPPRSSNSPPPGGAVPRASPAPSARPAPSAAAFDSRAHAPVESAPRSCT